MGVGVGVEKIGGGNLAKREGETPDLAIPGKLILVRLDVFLLRAQAKGLAQLAEMTDRDGWVEPEKT